MVKQTYENSLNILNIFYITLTNIKMDISILQVFYVHFHLYIILFEPSKIIETI